MKKKTKALPPKPAKRRKSTGEAFKAKTRVGTEPAARVGTKAGGKVAPGDQKLTIRRLRAQLAAALEQIEQLQASANTDFLLDIPNRRGFERELNRAIAYIKRYQATGALVVLDVDRLKPINDSFGHAAGDEVLKGIVATLLTQVRSSDVIGRLGGDEFALLLWNLSGTDACAKAADLEQAIDRLSFVFRGEVVRAGVSAGVVILDSHAEAGKALEQADSAMYVRKAQRRHEIAAP